MPLRLEYPGEPGDMHPDGMYLYRGADVPLSRSFITGDILSGLEARDENGTVRECIAIILQHPCSMRIDGVHLAPRILCAEVIPHSMFKPSQWTGNYHFMPLPSLLAGEGGDYAADFDRLLLLTPAQIEGATRIAILSQIGVNLLMQRHAHFLTRVVVPTFQLQEATAPFFEEADLCQEWCEGLIGFPEEWDESEKYKSNLENATSDFNEWIRQKDGSGMMRQKLLMEEQTRSSIRKEMREELRRRIRA